LGLVNSRKKLTWKNVSRKGLFYLRRAEIWGRRSRKIGGLPPVPPLVGDSLPYNPRKVVRVGVGWAASQALSVKRSAL